MATLFEYRVVQEFSQLLPDHLMNGYTLVSRTQFESLYAPRVRFASRRDIPIERLTAATAATAISSAKALTKIKSLALRVCRGGVGDVYAQEAVLDGMNENDIYDILFAIKTDTLTDFEDTERMIPPSIKQIEDSVDAFIVVEKGECKASNNVWCVKLICAGKNPDVRRRIAGKILLGACVYCIKQSAAVLDKKCFLELAGAYDNLPGLFTYMNLGFRSNPYLFARNCFYEVGNLPMSVDLTAGPALDIIQILTNEKEYGFDEDSDPSGLFRKKTDIAKIGEGKAGYDLIQKIQATSNVLYMMNVLAVNANDADKENAIRERYETFLAKPTNIELKQIYDGDIDGPAPVEERIELLKEDIAERWRQFCEVTRASSCTIAGGGRSKKSRSKKSRSKKSRSKKSLRRKHLNAK
jgi:hypothetical protein